MFYHDLISLLECPFLSPRSFFLISCLLASTFLGRDPFPSTVGIIIRVLPKSANSLITSRKLPNSIRAAYDSSFSSRTCLTSHLSDIHPEEVAIRTHIYHTHTLAHTLTTAFSRPREMGIIRLSQTIHQLVVNDRSVVNSTSSSDPIGSNTARCSTTIIIFPMERQGPHFLELVQPLVVVNHAGDESGFVLACDESCFAISVYF